MKKIFAQRRLIVLLHSYAAVFTLLALVCGNAYPEGLVFCAIGAAAFFAISLLAVSNRIFFDEKQICFHLLRRKRTCSHSHIHQIFVKRSFLLGYDVIFNFTTAFEEPCQNAIHYSLRAQNAGAETLLINCMAKRDLNRLLECYQGKVQYAAKR